MSAIAQFVTATDVSISLVEGDQLLLTGTAVFEDLGDGALLGQLLLEGTPVVAQILNPVSSGGLSSLNFAYAYSASENEIVDFEIYTPSDSISDASFSYLIVSGGDTQEIVNPSQNIAFGILFFFISMFLFLWFFKRAK